MRSLLEAGANIKRTVSLSLLSVVVLVDGVCTVANCVGKELAPHVKKHGSKLVPESLKRDKDGKSTLDGAMVVAASSVQGNKRPWVYFGFLFLFLLWFWKGTELPETLRQAVYLR